MKSAQKNKQLSASAPAFSPRRALPRAYPPRPTMSRPFYGRFYSEMIDLERERIRAKIAAIHHEEEVRRYKQMQFQRKERSEKMKIKNQQLGNNQGRGFKSKQKKINIVFDSLVTKFSKTPYLREEVDRSYETCRVHAKTYDGLMVLTDALDRVLNDPKIEMFEIGFHKSMKNKFQQKGILVYIKVGSQDQVERLFEIYNSYGRNLKDHAIAVTKEERAKLQAMKDAIKEAEAKTSDEPEAEVEAAAEVETHALGIKEA